MASGGASDSKDLSGLRPCNITFFGFCDNFLSRSLDAKEALESATSAVSYTT